MLTSRVRPPLLALPLGLLVACGGAAEGLNGPTASDQRGVTCGQSPAPGLFEHGVCVCDSFRKIGRIRVGPGPGGDPASVGVNGDAHSISSTMIEGDMVVHGRFEATANFETTGALTTHGDMVALGRLDVGSDLAVGGDLRAVGALSVGGAMAVRGDDRTIGYAQVGTRKSYDAGDAPPCACDGLDVVAEVEAARIDNDNEVRVLAERIASIGVGRLELETGRYYLKDFRSIGVYEIEIVGAVSLYVDGDIGMVGAQAIRIAPGAALDLYVAGSVREVGHVEVGDPNDPSAFRLYVAGGERITLIGNSRLNGSIFAPGAEIAWVGNTALDGALYARALASVGNLEIGYDRPQPVDVPPGACPPPADVEPPEAPPADVEPPEASPPEEGQPGEGTPPGDAPFEPDF